MPAPLLDHATPLPDPADPDAAARRLAEAREAPALAAALTDPRAANLLAAVFAASPFLTGLVLRDPGFAAHLLAADPDAVLDDVSAAVRALAAAEDDAALRSGLRRMRARLALLVALADLAGLWDCEQVTAALTRFADAAVATAVDWLLAEAHGLGHLTRLDGDAPGRGSGYVVLAMGKHGAGELNYSSDIDLIVLYDPAAAPLSARQEPATFFVRLTRKLVAVLQDVTGEGYVFRVDLRLRPDPRATQIAIAIEAAAIYYESMGQNWERAAMIKARPVAGDIALGDEFLARMRPYVWRKYLDFAAIADVQSLKRQIHAHRGHGAIAVAGHNIKLGRGGIREIEFFVQTQQLIAGGRNPALRGRRTLDMLAALAGAGWITAEAADELARAYRTLRTLEHRLQMQADEQTQTLPSAPDALTVLARFAGFADAEAFTAHLTAILERVQTHYARLFEDAPALGSDAGSLVFTGGEDDPETLETLAAMGYRQTSEISATIRGWHFGRYPATRSARARERLTELMPALLTALSRTGEPDNAFLAFDRFIAGLPAGVQLFSLLRANPHLLELLATVLGSAPRLAEELSKRPKQLDAVLDPGFFGPMPGRDELVAAVAAAVPPESTFEEALDRARVIGREKMLRIGMRILSETVTAGDAGAAYSALAEALIARLLVAVEDDMARAHGRVAGGRHAVLALGKLGGREMTATSDLDLILIYDHAADAEQSDGRRPLGPAAYYIRFTQRLIAALSSPTAEGVLYDVDMRLRPSGSKGPVATQLASFEAYHRDSAWTWEKMALTRARVVAGDAALAGRIGAIVQASLTAPRDPAATRADIVAMRMRMLAEHGARAGPWDLKQVRGGLVDVEFIAQGLELLHAHAYPQVLAQTTVDALDRLRGADLLGRQPHERLREACLLYHRLTHVLRLSVASGFDPATAPEGLRALVARAAAVPDIATLEALLADCRDWVTGCFDELIGPLPTDSPAVQRPLP